MSKFILFTAGVLSARYDSEINETIPPEAIEVDDETFFKTINEKDGIWSLVKKQIVKQPLPVVVPPDPRETMEVSTFQAKAALSRLGYYQSVLDIMANPATPLETKLAWDNVQTFKRLSSTVITLAVALKLNDQQLDELFALAKTIQA